MIRAPKTEAKRLLAALDLENGHAAKGVQDLQGLIEAWRQAGQAAWHTLIKLLTTGVLVTLIVGASIKLKLYGGVQ